MEGLPSSRYATSVVGDKYDRHRIFIEMVGFNRDVLELGCSTGFLSRHFVENGCKVTGVEIDAEAAEAARSACDRVETIDINDAGWINRVGGRFDAILFGDVLEHLVDPLKTLCLSRQLLRDDGYIVISLPNVAHWTVRLKLLTGNFDYKDQGVLDTTHLRFFTMKSALKLVEQAGFKVREFRPIIGGKLSGHFRRSWQLGARLFPGVFAVQMIFLVTPKEAA
jgi:2-polyprenyl-3-methyl-5-hydroxy-6-metoxy-1,4-benzoquinol methylase